MRRYRVHLQQKPASADAICTVLQQLQMWSVGHAVVQFVEALRYKPQGRGFDSQWCHWNFSLT